MGTSPCKQPGHPLIPIALQRDPWEMVNTFLDPCAMCAGTIYWAGIGRVLYGAEETALLALTGDHPENPTLALPCRTVYASGQRPTEVLGPVPALQDEITALHRDFWQ